MWPDHACCTLTVVVVVVLVACLGHACTQGHLVTSTCMAYANCSAVHSLADWLEKSGWLWGIAYTIS